MLPCEVNGVPRRICKSYWTPAEQAVQDAVDLVERLGADVRLTEAVNLLAAARAKIADYVESKQYEPER